MRRNGLKVVVYSDAVTYGGAEQAVSNLLACLDPSYDVVVLAVDDTVGRSIRRARDDAALRVIRPVRNKWDIGRILEHARTVRSLRPDVFHANLWATSCGQYGVAAALLVAGVRTVVVEHSPLPSSSPLQRLLKRQTIRRVTAHVAVGRRAARQVEQATGIPSGTVRTIYNGVPDVPVDPLSRLAEGPVIGALGRLSPEKGFDVAIRALPAVPGATLALVGDGPERGRLEALAEELGVRDRVVFAGWSESARRYLPGFDVLVLPSRLEGFPLAVVEGMLAELPVVACDVGSVREAVRDGETGFVVPPDDVEALGDRLRLVLADAELRRDLGQAGRTRALKLFTAEAMTRRFEALYDEILA